jgi:hypothetical protein
MTDKSIPTEQCTPYGDSTEKVAATTIPQRRSSALIPWVRYRDLVEANVVNNWTQLLRLIDGEGFPAGIMLSPNIRAWRLDQVNAWLADRPTARKVPPPASKPRGRRPRVVEANT